MSRARVAWEHTLGERHVCLSIVAERGEDFIDEHHLYHVRDRSGATALESLTMRRVYRWDHARLTPLLEEVGFVDVRTDHFPNVKGYHFAMNRAFRPR